MKIFQVSKLKSNDKRNLDSISSELIKIIPDEKYALNFIEGVKKYESKDTWMITKTKKKKIVELNIKDNISKIQLLPNGLMIEKKLIGVNIFDILASIFNIEREDTSNFSIIREKIIIPDDVVEQ